jgi:hypothetical protein
MPADLHSPTAYRKRFGKTHYVAVFDDVAHDGARPFSYVASFGPDSDRSHSGCFWRLGLDSIEAAMAAIDAKNLSGS